MLGKTHTAAGAAAALLLLHPSEPAAVLSAAAGGAAGGWICDIDCRDAGIDSTTGEDILYTAGLTAALLLGDALLGSGVCAWMASHWGLRSAAAFTVFLVCCMFGWNTPHRSFMHSLTALVLLTVSLHFFCAPLAPAFAAGFVSHLLLDLTNFQGIQLFYPLRDRFCLRLFPADGLADRYLLCFCSIFSVCAGTVLFMHAMTGERSLLALVKKVLTSGPGPGRGGFQLYLVTVNLLSFTAWTADGMYSSLTGRNSRRAGLMQPVYAVLNCLGLMGGAFGMLLSVLLLHQRATRWNRAWISLSVSLSVAWGAVCTLVFDPFHWGITPGLPSLMRHLPLFGFLAAVNILTAALFLTGPRTRKKDWSGADTARLAAGLLGGTPAGLLVILLTDRYRQSAVFSCGFPVILAVQTCILTALLAAGF